MHKCFARLKKVAGTPRQNDDAGFMQYGHHGRIVEFANLIRPDDQRPLSFMALIWMAGVRCSTGACRSTIDAMLAISAMFVASIGMTRVGCGSITG